MRATLTNCVSLGALVLAVASPARAQNLPPELARDLARVYAPPASQTRQADNLLRLSAQHDAPANSVCLLPNVNMSHNISTPRDVFSDWHCLALTVLAVDHIPYPGSDGTPQFYQNFGPHRASWAMAMFHLTMFEVTNAYLTHPRDSWIAKQPSGAAYGDLTHGQGDESAAIASAAYTILARMYPKFDNKSLSGNFGNLSDELKASIASLNCGADAGCAMGTAFGAKIAEAVFDLRINDKSAAPEVGWAVGFTPNNWAPNPFQWEIDPVSQNKIALGANWGAVTPFQIDRFDNAQQMIPGGLDLKPPPVMLNFAVATPKQRRDFYNDQLDNEMVNGQPFRVIDHGGDPHHEPIPGAMPRSAGQLRADYFQGIFWSYDGTAGICAPVRLYNQIADTLVSKYYHDLVPSGPDLDPASGAETAAQSVDSAASLAYFYYVINTGMVDAGIAAWHYKYFYQYFRPVTGINAFWKADGAMGGFSHEHLTWSPSWYPLGGQNTNTGAGFNPTPPFPAYPSGHSVFGGAFFSLLQKFFTSGQQISFQSDELNGGQHLGENVDAYGFNRCAKPSSPGAPPNYGFDAQFCKDFTYSSFSDASQANSMSRILLGVHWPADADNGKDLGERIGMRVCDKTKCPVGRSP